MAPAGEEVPLPPGPSSFLEIEVTGDTAGRLVDYHGQDPVGFAEVDLAGLRADEVVRAPTALLDDLGEASQAHPLALVFTRDRVDARKRWRDDPEPAIVRSFSLPAERAFALSGAARRSARASDEVLAGLLPAGPPTAVVTSRLAGVPAAGGPAAIDGDLTTAWQTAFGPATGAAITVTLPGPATVDHLDLQVLADGRHSVPTALVVSNGTEARTIAVPAVDDDPQRIAPTLLPVGFPALGGTTFTVTIAGTRDVTTLDRHDQTTVTLPVAVAELGLPGTGAVGSAGASAPPAWPSDCRTDLLTIDDRPLPIRLSGDADTLLGGQALAVEGCDASASGVVLGPGEHVLRAAPGVVTGLDLDRLVLTSGAGGEAAPPSALLPPADSSTGPTATVVDDGRTSRRVEVTGGEDGFWLVLGEGLNEGWHASVGGRDLGPPVPVDGGMNGWLVTNPGPEPVTIDLTWRPQRLVWAGLAASAAGVVLCLVLALTRPRRASPATAAAAAEPPVPRSLRARPADGWPIAWLPLLVATAAVALLTALAFHPLAAPVVIAAMVVAGRVPRVRWLCAALSAASLAAVGAFYVARQWQARPEEGFGWPSRFEVAHPAALAAVAFLVADVTLSLLAMRARGAARPPSVPSLPADPPAAPTPAAAEHG